MDNIFAQTDAEVQAQLVEDEEFFVDNFFDFEDEMAGATTSVQPLDFPTPPHDQASPLYVPPQQEQQEQQPHSPAHCPSPKEQASPLHHSTPLKAAQQVQPWPVFSTPPPPPPPPQQQQQHQVVPVALSVLMSPPSPLPRFARPRPLPFTPKSSLQHCPPVCLDHLMGHLQAFDHHRAAWAALCPPVRLLAPPHMSTGHWEGHVTPLPAPPTPPLDVDVFDMDTFSWGDEDEEEEDEEVEREQEDEDEDAEEVATRVGGKRKAPSPPTQPAKKPKAATKEGKSHAQLKPSRVRPYAYLGMAEERDNFLDDWTRAVQATWSEVFPGVSMPASLDIQDPQHVEWVVLMLAYLCPLKGVPTTGRHGFTPANLRAVFSHPKGRKLFTDDSFLHPNLTTATGKHLSVGSGLLSLLARALEVEHYTDITNDANVLMWYNKIGPK